MQVPIIQGLIDRRILINFRVEPNVLTAMLPKPFRPKLVGGYGIAGVCLIRLKQIRPRWMPKAFGVGSENAAHRIAVEWDQEGECREGVFIPRRDTSSRFNTFVGGRLFPGVHHHAHFHVEEQNDHYSIAVDSDDNQTHIAVKGQTADKLPQESVFGSLDEASTFFQRGSLGYSTTLQPGQFDGLELRSFHWSVTPLAVEAVASSFFENRQVIPSESITFDCALLMRNVEHEWHARQPISCR